MEGFQPEGTGEKPRSLVEQKRLEAFASLCDAIDDRFSTTLGSTFELKGREYELTSAEDCMVAYAGHMRKEMKTLYDEVIAREDYYEEKAAAKLFELFKAYERLIALYAELRSYYPSAAERVETHLPPLTECVKHGEWLFTNRDQAN